MMPDVTRLDTLRARRPLIHCISNLVTANDCANLLLAAGASPVMAQALPEAEEITAASAASVLNTGTPDDEKFRLCLACGRAASALGHPTVLDPVGIGASRWRLQSIQGMLHLFTPSILRVNLGEARALLQLEGGEQGVDTPAGAPEEARLQAAAALARQRRTLVLLSGPEDVIASGDHLWRVRGGSDLMPFVTGTGCMLSVLCGAFAAVAEPEEAAVLASAFWKCCSARAQAQAGGRGPGSFRAALMDAAYTLTARDLLQADITALS